MVEAALHESSYPRLESGARWSLLTVSVPALGAIVRRDPVLRLITANDVLSLSAAARAAAAADSIRYPHVGAAMHAAHHPPRAQLQRFADGRELIELIFVQPYCPTTVRLFRMSQPLQSAQIGTQVTIGLFFGLAPWDRRSGL